MALNERGWEVPDPKPMSLATGLRKPPTLEETVARVMRSHQALAMLKRSAGVEETPEEAEDFDIPDDPIDALTKYEFEADRIPISDMKARLLATLTEKPALADRIRDLFGHLFKNGELKVKPAPPAPNPPEGTPSGGPPLAEPKPEGKPKA